MSESVVVEAVSSPESSTSSDLPSSSSHSQSRQGRSSAVHEPNTPAAALSHSDTPPSRRHTAAVDLLLRVLAASDVRSSLSALHLHTNQKH